MFKTRRKVLKVAKIKDANYGCIDEGNYDGVSHQSVISQSSVSHQSVISQSSVSHQSVISQLYVMMCAMMCVMMWRLSARTRGPSDRSSTRSSAIAWRRRV